MSDNPKRPRTPRPALPTFLTQPASADLLLAILAEHAESMDRADPVGGAVGATVDGWLAEILTAGYGTGYDPRTARANVRVPIRPTAVGGTGD